jgi:hypothetical protein
MSRFLHTIERSYHRVFNIHEIEEQPILQWMFGALLFYFFVSFSVWIRRDYTTVELAKQLGATCWPFFKHCGDFYFLHALPYGYSQNILYMCFYAIMVFIVYLMWRKRWVYAHMLISLLLCWKLYVIGTNYLSEGPYDYYHIFLLIALLYIPHKEYFLKVTFVWMYFLSATIKFTPAWVLGTYFSSMVTGIPLVPSWAIAIATNIVIFGQVIECWFLLSKNYYLQKISFWYAIFFHVFSGILVGYDYPSVSLPPVAILFGPMYRHTPTPFKKTALWGWALIACMGFFQLLGFSIPTDRFLTLEGNRLGMFMFEANHQCVVTVTTLSSRILDTKSDFESPAGTPCSGFYCLVKRSTNASATSSMRTLRYESATAWNRCDPYEWWSQLQDNCQASTTERIGFTFDHSINGGPFYRIVNLPNICAVDYKPLQHNDWILLPPQARIVGYPVQNWYHY